MRMLFISFILMSLNACNVKADDSKKTIEIEIISENGFNYETYEVLKNNWGYKIFKDGSLMINQPHIPSIQGNRGFNTENKAATAAQFIIKKLKNNIFPPSFSVKELDSLGLL